MKKKPAETRPTTEDGPLPLPLRADGYEPLTEQAESPG
jgi:hypothetical protein